MISLHGFFEWIIVLAFVLAGYAVCRYVGARKWRYSCYALTLLVAFVFDLNKIVFRSDVLNGLWISLVLLIVAEFFWVCIYKRTRPLMCAAFVFFTPTFIYAYMLLLSILPLPCHELTGVSVDKYTACNNKVYHLAKLPSLDPFKPAPVYALFLDIRNTPLKKRVDEYPLVKGYVETQFSIGWECANGKAKANLITQGYAGSGYALHTLRDKSGE